MNAGKLVTVVPPVKALDEFQRPSICHNFEISPDNRLIAFVGSQGQIHLFSVKVSIQFTHWLNKKNEQIDKTMFQVHFLATSFQKRLTWFVEYYQKN